MQRLRSCAQLPLSSQFQSTKDEPSSPTDALPTIYPTPANTFRLPAGFSFDGESNVLQKAPTILYRDVRPQPASSSLSSPSSSSSMLDVSMLHPTMFVVMEQGQAFKSPRFAVPFDVFVKQGVVTVEGRGIVTENARLTKCSTLCSVNIHHLCKSTVLFVPFLGVSGLKDVLERLRSNHRLPIREFHCRKRIGRDSSLACVQLFPVSTRSRRTT